MTKQELRTHRGYKEVMDKILRYREGFQFTINFSNIPRPKAKGLQLILRDACELGFLESVAIGLDIQGNWVEETYKRTAKEAC